MHGCGITLVHPLPGIFAGAKESCKSQRFEDLDGSRFAKLLGAAFANRSCLASCSVLGMRSEKVFVQHIHIEDRNTL